MNTDRQPFRNNFAATGTLLRCTLGVDQYDSPTSFFRFVLTELYESSPGYICYAPVDYFVPVGLHILNLQVLKSNELMFIDQFSTFLMSKIIAPVRLSLVGVTKRMDRLVSLKTAFWQFLFLSLQAGNILGVLFHPALPLDAFAIRQDSERRQSQINPHNLISRRQQLRLDNTAKAGVPVAHTVPSNCQGLAFALKRPVQLDFHLANLGKTQAIIGQEAPITFLLRIREGVIAMPTTETRVSRFFTGLDTLKEGPKRKVKSLQGFLHGLSMTVLEPFVFLFPAGQHLDCIISANTLLPLLPRLFASLKSLVVDKAASVKLKLQGPMLGSSREQAVLK